MARSYRHSLRDQFYALVPHRPDDGCWHWAGPRTGFRGSGNDYGQFWLWVDGRRRSFRAHRVSYKLHFGPIPDGMYICHRCDSPSCVRPDHLFLGTPADNTRDMVAKGRHRPRGKTRKITVQGRGETLRLPTPYYPGGAPPAPKTPKRVVVAYSEEAQTLPTPAYPEDKPKRWPCPGRPRRGAPPSVVGAAPR